MISCLELDNCPYSLFREVCVFINNQVNKKQSKLFEVSIIAKQDRYGTHDVANG